MTLDVGPPVVTERCPGCGVTIVHCCLDAPIEEQARMAETIIKSAQERHRCRREKDRRRARRSLGLVGR